MKSCNTMYTPTFLENEQNKLLICKCKVTDLWKLSLELTTFVFLLVNEDKGWYRKGMILHFQWHTDIWDRWLARKEEIHQLIFGNHNIFTAIRKKHCETYIQLDWIQHIGKKQIMQHIHAIFRPCETCCYAGR